MSEYEPVGQRWWDQPDPGALASEVWSIAQSLEEDHAGAHERYREFLSVYEGRRLDGLDPGVYARQSEYESFRINLSRSLCDTVQADIAGRQKPRPQFMTSGADWQTRRRAKKLDKFVEGVLRQPQMGGRYVDGWELAVDVFLDAGIWGLGFIHVFADSNPDRVALERVFPWEILVDPFEARYGDPQTLMRVHHMDRLAALCLFVDDGEGSTEEKAAREVAIKAAQSVRDPREQMRSRTSQQIRIIEAWRLPISEDEPGKHVFVLEGCVLHEEPWERDSFPLVAMRWSAERMGYGAQGLVEEARPLQRELDEWSDRTSEAMRLRTGRRTYYEQGSLDEESLQANDCETFVKVKPGSAMPQVEAVPPLSPAEFEYGDRLVAWGYRMTGVSEMSAASRKEPGVDSGVAIRTMIDLATKRFSVKAKGYENAFVALGKEIARCAATIDNYKVKFPGSSVYEEIPWSDVSLDEDQYQVSVAPASALPNDPAGRLSTVQELLNVGLIDAATFRRLLDWPDLEKEFSRENAEYEYIEAMVDRYLDADEETAADPGFYESPEGFLFGRNAALLQVGAAYFTAKREGAPELNLDLLRQWMTDLQEQDQRAQAQAAAAMGAQVPGAPPAIPPPSVPNAPGGPAAPPLPPGMPAAA